jgi:hypothetical protein
MNTRIKEEPALALALVQAVIALAVSFGLSLSPEQVGAILASVAAAAALFLRQRVSPTQAVAEPVEQTTAIS